jgi:integrase
LVCTSTTGAPLEPRAIQRRFHHLVAMARVSPMRLYDARHTATSLMLDAGADLKATSETLGHHDPVITMRVYRHVRGDQRAQALTLLAGSLDALEVAEGADHRAALTS